MVVSLLVDWQWEAHPSIYLTAQERIDAELEPGDEPIAHNSLYLDNLNADEIEGFVKSLESSRRNFTRQELEASGLRVRDDIGDTDDNLHPASAIRPLGGIWLDAEFDRLSKWLWVLRLVDGEKRKKHWPPAYVKTQDDLIAYSKEKSEEGWLNVGSSHEKLRRFGLALLAAYFFEKLKSRTDQDSITSRFEEFLDTWATLFEQGTFRLGLTHSNSMGFSNGKACTNVVYDFDPSGMQFHCFPVDVFQAGMETFREDQLELFYSRPG